MHPLSTLLFCLGLCVDTFANNIEIKKIKNIDNFESWFSMTNQGKLLTKLNPRYVLRVYLDWSI
jgi:hypothetical protein